MIARRLRRWTQRNKSARLTEAKKIIKTRLQWAGLWEKKIKTKQSPTNYRISRYAIIIAFLLIIRM